MTQHVSSPFRRALGPALLLCFFVSYQTPAAASFPPAEDAAAQALSPKDRKEIFTKVWREIEQRYYDSKFNGVDWNGVRRIYEPQILPAQSDTSFYDLIKRMVEELHDAHTRFSTRVEWQNRQKYQGVSIGFAVDRVEQETVVTAVATASAAARSGIAPGMILLSIDDKPVEALLAASEARHAPDSSPRADLLRAYNDILAGPEGSVAKLAFQRADGSTWETNVARELRAFPPRILEKRLPSGIAYIRFDEFQPSTPRDVREALERVRTAPGLIIDLRSNSGGTLGSTLQIAGYLLPKRTRFALDRTRTGKPISSFGGLFRVGLELYAGKKGDQIYSGPIALLVRGRTASAAEIFAAGLQEAGRAKVFGTQTCGCALGIIKDRKVKGGGVLEISEMLWLTPKGRRLEGEGVLPDREVSATIADLQQRRDALLETADKALRAAIQSAQLKIDR